MSENAAEEARAAAWRAEQVRRVAAEAARAAALRGDPAAARAVYAAWLPILQANREQGR